MKSHRVRSAESIDSNSAPILFVEIERDSWLEIAELPTHVQIHLYVSECERTNRGQLTYATRAFDIGIVKNWIESDPIVEK